MDSEVRLQKPFAERKEEYGFYSVTEGEDTEGKAYFSYNTVCGDGLDRNLYRAFPVLSYVLVQSIGAPKKIVKEGLNQQSLLAAINGYEFQYREADFGNFPKGLMYGLQIFDSWLYDENKPFIHIQANDTFAFLKKQVGTDYFEKIIEKYLLKNPHATFVSVQPKVGLTTLMRI